MKESNDGPEAGNVQGSIRVVVLLSLSLCLSLSLSLSLFLSLPYPLTPLLALFDAVAALIFLPEYPTYS